MGTGLRGWRAPSWNRFLMFTKRSSHPLDFDDLTGSPLTVGPQAETYGWESAGDCDRSELDHLSLELRRCAVYQSPTFRGCIGQPLRATKLLLPAARRISLGMALPTAEQRKDGEQDDETGYYDDPDDHRHEE